MNGAGMPGSGRARGPKGLAREGRGREDPTFTRWGEEPPLAEEHRASLAEAESHAAYRWAAGAVAGRDVLDVGAGAGHGASLLLDAGARSVVGVDSDSNAVDAATRLYGARLRFLHAEPMALPLAPGSFHVVTCFGIIEAAPDPEAVLAGVRRVLTDDGLLLVSLSTNRAEGATGGRGAEEWRNALLESFRNVRLHRSRLCIAAAIGPSDAAEPVALDDVAWLPGARGEDRATLAVASDAQLPELSPVASMTDFRDLREYRRTMDAWEERARRAEADGSAKHWEFVAAREAQRRLRKRVHELEHRPLRMLWRVLRGGPARVGQGPPIRASERGPERWE